MQALVDCTLGLTRTRDATGVLLYVNLAHHRAEVLAELPDGVSTPEIKVDVVDGTPHAIVERFVEGAEFEGARLSTIDGLRADWDDGWGLVRASNTTPILVLRFEADNTAALERIKDEFRARLQALAPELTMTF